MYIGRAIQRLKNIPIDKFTVGGYGIRMYYVTASKGIPGTIEYRLK
jgi:hypothetical protein